MPSTTNNDSLAPPTTSAINRPVSAPCTTSGTNRPPTPPPATLVVVATTRMVASRARIVNDRWGSSDHSTAR